MNPDFVRQLRWEARKLWRRPFTRVALGAVLLFEVLLSVVLSLPVVQEQISKTIWQLHERYGIEQPFSTLSLAIEIVSQTMMFVGGVSLVLLATEVVAKEAENGTLRMIFCRPVSRSAVFFQKLLVCLLSAVVMCFVVGSVALVLGGILGEPGRFVVLTARESIFGVHDFGPGLARYALAIVLLPASFATVVLFAFALSCLPVKPSTVTMAALLVLLADWAIQAHPTLAPISPYTLTTRILSWRQVFGNEIPWLRLQRNYSDLLVLDLLLVGVAWAAFRVRNLIPR